MKISKCFCQNLFAGLLLFAASLLPAAEYSILLAPDASPVEKTAAAEMQLFAGKLLGKNVPIVTKTGGKGQYIRIGATADAEKVLQVKFADFKDDELIIRSVNGDIYLAGGARRGTLYAVYEYLERFCGVRFLTPDVNHIPALKTPDTLPAANFRYLPRIKVRLISLRKNTPAEKIFAARRRINGSLNHMLPLSAELGGGEHIIGCHTFQKFVRPTPAGLAKNPDFYSMIKGKRVHNGQVCMTNPRLRKYMIESFKNWLKENPQATRVSVSMNDYNRFCECPECVQWMRSRKAIISDLLLDFVNEVAAGLEKDFPSIEVVTLAYLNASKPPKVIKPRRNVGIFYCLIDVDTSKPLSHPRNRKVREEIEGWNATGAKIYCWVYSINQKNPFLTQPNWEALDADIRFMADRKAEWLFCEFTYPENYITDFIRLRYYVKSRLMWCQEKSMDELIAEFCVPYYGAAAPKIMEALKIMRQAPAKNQDVFVCNFASSVIRAFGTETFLAAWQKMQEARKIAYASGDKELQKRVELAAMAYDMTLLHDCFHLRNQLPAVLKGFDPIALFDRDVAVMKSYGITNFFGGKYRTWAAYRERVVHLWGQNDGEVPAGIEKVPGTLVWSAAKFHNIHRDRRMGVVNDPEAFGGKALQVVSNGRRWPRLELDNALRGKYRIYLTLKVDIRGKSKGVLMTGNVWESGARWARRGRAMPVRLSANPGKGYELYKVGEAVFRGSYDLQLPVPSDPAIRNIWIDRIIMVPVK